MRMAMHETQTDALSRLYARSLFELAEQEGGQARIEEVGAELGEILDLARSDKTFGEFLASRIIPAKERGVSLRRIFEGRITGLTLRFVLLLNQKDRLNKISSIASAYDETVQEKFGRVEVDVYTAEAVDRALVERIGQALKRALGKDPVVHPYTEPAMIGGFKVQVGDQLIDASLATRLRRMKERFAGPGAAALRARAQGIIEGKA